MQFLRQAWQLPGLFVADDLDEYSPGTEEMQWLYDISSNSGRKLVHYSAKEDALWQGTSLSTSAKFPPPAITGRICSRLMLNSPAS